MKAKINKSLLLHYVVVGKKYSELFFYLSFNLLYDDLHHRAWFAIFKWMCLFWLFFFHLCATPVSSYCMALGNSWWICMQPHFLTRWHICALFSCLLLQSPAYLHHGFTLLSAVCCVLGAQTVLQHELSRVVSKHLHKPLQLAWRCQPWRTLSN